MPLHSEWRDEQRRFARALTRADVELLDLRDAEPNFAVYRNNVVAGLIDVLTSKFSVVAQLVGEAFFRAMAREYALKHLPTSPVMNEYGASFPRFIAAFEPARTAPYLGDVASLEWAWQESYRAVDAPTLTVRALMQLPPERLATARFAPHPSVRLLSSPFPIVGLWAMHRDGVGEPPQEWCAERALVWRPEREVNVHALPEHSYAFVSALCAGQCVADAAERAATVDPAFDAGPQLVEWVRLGACVDIALANE